MFPRRVVLVVGNVMFWYAVMIVDDTKGMAPVAARIEAASFILFEALSVLRNGSVGDKRSEERHSKSTTLWQNFQCDCYIAPAHVLAMGVLHFPLL